jgi:hypothetical protein
LPSGSPTPKQPFRTSIEIVFPQTRPVAAIVRAVQMHERSFGSIGLSGARHTRQRFRCKHRLF